VAAGPDSGADQPALLAGVLDQVYAAGFQLGIPKYGVSVKYLHEFEGSGSRGRW
jgi:putative NADPH-quinone reductase